MRILVTGASGRLGFSLLARLAGGLHDVVAWSGTSAGTHGTIALQPVDLTDAAIVLGALDAADADVVIHAAAISSAEAARRDPGRAWAVNVEGTRLLADWAARRDRRLVFTSTDLVFDGQCRWYREDDPAEPIVEYGRSKRAAELPVLAVPGGLVARLSLMYAPGRPGASDFFDRALSSLRAGEPQAFFVDEFRTPLDYCAAADFLVRLAESEHTGLVHLGGRERLSRYELMRRAAMARGISSHLVLGNCRADARLAEPRPADVSLDTSRLISWFPGACFPTVEAASCQARGLMSVAEPAQ
jgi:dTDP-4-dehydrorhamnose reductase